MKAITTLDEARRCKYGQWSGNPNGTVYREGHCVQRVFNAHRAYQCTRKNGHGPAKLYCKQHSPESVKAREEENERRWKEKRARSPYVLLRKAQERIEELEAENARLKDQAGK